MTRESKEIPLRLLDTTACLYEAALDPGRWGDFIELTRSALCEADNLATENPNEARWLRRQVDRAARICGEVLHLQLDAEAVDWLQNELDLGVIVLDSGAKCLFVNRTAEALLETGDGVCLENGCPTSKDPRAAAVLQDWIRAATSARKGSAVRDEIGSMQVSRVEGHPLGVLVLPLYAPFIPKVLSPGHLPRALVLISDPDRGRPVDEAQLQARYELTPAEARLALLLLRGRTVEEAARRLGIKISTARSQLKSVFLKTQTQRQPELVRLLLTLPSL